MVSLTYHPAKNTLTIVILKAKNLKAKDINGKSGKIFGRHDIQYNDTPHDDIQQNDTEHKGPISDAQHKRH